MFFTRGGKEEQTQTDRQGVNTATTPYKFHQKLKQTPSPIHQLHIPYFTRLFEMIIY